MINRIMTKRILLSMALLLGISSFETTAITSPASNSASQSQFKQFYDSLSRVISVPYRDAKVMWQWGVKKVKGQEISAQLEKKAQRSFLRTAVPIATIITLVSGVMVWRKAATNISTKDAHGNTLLHLAVANGDIGAAQKAINAKADINLKNNYGNTPLHIAVITNNVPLVKMLVDAKANIGIKDNNGHSPLFYVEKGQNKEMIDFFKTKTVVRRASGG